MGTFLTTPKMNPALAARIEASVTGRAAVRVDPGARTRRLRRITSLARVVVVLGLTWALWSAFHAFRQSHIDLESARARLLDRARGESASLRDADKKAVARALDWLVRLSGPWEGDLVDAALRAEGLAQVIGSRPSIYVRAPIEALADPATISGAAASSPKDSLLFCLADPPPARTEAVLLEKVRVSYGAGSVVETQTANTRRLDELLVGMPFLLPPWSESVRAAPDRAALVRMQRDFDRAPIARAKQAARAPLLLVAMDEPGSGGGPTELDGERPHAIRLFLVDLDEGKLLLRARKVVDPSWISAAKRPHYARGLDSCAFAFDVHEEVKRR